MNDVADREIALFNAALLLPEQQRSAYLDETCAQDLGLRQRVQILLQAHRRAGAFLEEPVTGGRALLDSAGVIEAPGNIQMVERPGDRIGRYNLLRQIGEGGCGVVYLAEQEEPIRRQVAIKILKLGMDTRQVISRFEAERQTLAMMEHPNIAKVLDAGATETGRPYFAMELVQGEKITDYCNRNKLTVAQRLELFIQTCRAIQHAHQKGIIHRDIKPSNILVTLHDPDKVGMPKVIDFGIAKATQGRLADHTFFTASEQFIGTPAYMSPEQALQTSLDVDTRSDIYSLGVLLYELLTGQTPFDQKQLLAAGLEEMRLTIRQKEPVRPSNRLGAMGEEELRGVASQRRTESFKLVHQVRGDLDSIVMKCLEKDRSRRYETANGLAVDIGHFLANEPIEARAPSRLYRVRKLIGRNKLIFAATTAVIAALLTGLSFSTWQYIQKSKAEREQSRLRLAAQEAQARESQSRRRAEEQELAARKKAYASDMNLLQQALAEDNLGRAQELLNRQRPQPGQQDLRAWEWRYFWQFCQSDIAFTLCRRSNSITSVSFSSNGALLAVGTWVGEVTVWDLAARRMIFQKTVATGGSGKLAFALTSGLLAFSDSSTNRTEVVLWDSNTRAELHRLPLGAQLRDLAFSRDGRLFTADLAQTNNVVVWDPASGNALQRFTAVVPSYVNGVVFAITEDGTKFANVSRSAPRLVRIADLDAGTNFSLSVADELTTALALPLKGGLLCTGAGYAEGAIKLWGMLTARQIGTLEGHRSWISCLKALPDGNTLASASADRTVRLWDVQGRRLLRTLRGENAELWTLDISPDGRWLAAGSKDGSVPIWDLDSTTNRPSAYRTLQPAPSAQVPSYSPDGKWFCVLRQGRLELYDSNSLQPLHQSIELLTNTLAYSFSANMRQVLATSMDGQLAAWQLPSHTLITNFLAHPSFAIIDNQAFLTGGVAIVSLGADFMYKEWDTTTWKEIKHWPVEARMRFWCVSPATGLIATCDGKEIELVSADRPERRRKVAGNDRVVGIALSADGGTLAAASENGTMELWNTQSGSRIALLHGVLLGYHSVAFSPDGQRLAAGSNGREAIKLFDVKSQEEVATLPGQGSFFSRAAFSPDGNTICAVNWNGRIHFWTAPSWSQIESAERAQPPPSPP